MLSRLSTGPRVSIASPNNTTPRNSRSLQGTFYIQVTALLLVNSYVISPVVALYLCKNLTRPVNFCTMHIRQYTKGYNSRGLGPSKVHSCQQIQGPAPQQQCLVYKAASPPAPGLYASVLLR